VIVVSITFQDGRRHTGEARRSCGCHIYSTGQQRSSDLTSIEMQSAFKVAPFEVKLRNTDAFQNFCQRCQTHTPCVAFLTNDDGAHSGCLYMPIYRDLQRRYKCPLWCLSLIWQLDYWAHTRSQHILILRRHAYVQGLDMGCRMRTPAWDMEPARNQSTCCYPRMRTAL
jgi:hypothetical protein